MNKLKTIFFGTPDLSVPYLELLYQTTDVQLVVTQADKPRGRGMEITPCPVKKRALELGLPVLSPEKLKDDFDKIAAVPFDLGVAVAYGKIFRPNFLELPKLGILNVHFSLLPRLRGAAPVQQALIQGYTRTGISVFWIRPGMDDGPLFLQKECDILPQDDAHTLFAKLIPLGLEGLKETLAQIASGSIVQTPQEGEPTLAPMLQKEDALLRPALLSAKKLNDRARGLACGPKPMLRNVAKVAQEFGLPCQVSMEERMGCGVGACLVCACDMADGSRKHVCKDGPVFDSKEVDWNA